MSWKEVHFYLDSANPAWLLFGFNLVSLVITEHVLPYLAPDAVVFIHDYVVRPHYHTMAQKHYTEIARVSDGQTLVVLKPRSRLQLLQGGS